MDPLLISKTPYHAFCEERELPICKRSIIGEVNIIAANVMHTFFMRKF